MKLPEKEWRHQRAYPGRLTEYGPDVRELLIAGAIIPATAYVEAQRVQGIVIAHTACATVPIQAPRIDEVDPALSDGWRRARAPLSRLTRLFNLTGLPAVSAPAGWIRTGLPIGVQLAAAPGEEDRLLAVAAALEAKVRRTLPLTATDSSTGGAPRPPRGRLPKSGQTP